MRDLFDLICCIFVVVCCIGAFKDVLKSMPAIRANSRKIHNDEENTAPKDRSEVSLTETCGLIFRPFLILIMLASLIGSARINHCK